MGLADYQYQQAQQAAAAPAAGAPSGIPLAAGIQAFGSLVGGLLNSKAEAKKRKLAALQEGQNAQLQAQQNAAQQLGQGSQSAFAQLMSSYGNIIGR